VIAFEHGAMRHGGEPLLAGILVHGVLKVADAMVITFLAHAERLTVHEWLEILAPARGLRHDAHQHEGWELTRCEGDSSSR
jgi:hypothetical protein